MSPLPPSRDGLRVLVDRTTAARLSRRGFLGLAGLSAVGLGLSACGGDSGSTGGSPLGSGASATPGSSAGGGAGGGTVSGALNVYTWAEYTDPDVVAQFKDARGVDVSLDVYDSNEAAIAKLELAKSSSGYDIVVPTGTFVPQMVRKGLLQELDKAKLPNLANVDPVYLDQPWDKGNRYSVCKDWGTTGIVYDTEVVKEPIKGWADYLRVAAQPEVSGKVSALAVPADLAGIVFWRDGIDWTTTDPAQLDRAQQVLRDELVPHLKAFDSYPAAAMLEGSYVLAQAFNGDARTVVLEDPDRYKWTLGAPKTEIWMDNWTITADAKNPDAAHAFINDLLDPQTSAKEVDFHGYHTGLKGIREALPDLEQAEIVFFSDEQVATMVPGEVNEAQERLVKMLNDLRAAAGT